MANIYIASSWLNNYHTMWLQLLRANGHEVYDYRNPKGEGSPPGEGSFRWGNIDPGWRSWKQDGYLKALEAEESIQFYSQDMTTMEACNTCLLILPSGRGSHLEAGYLKGTGKRLVIWLSPNQPVTELMYKLGDVVTADINTVLQSLTQEQVC